MKKNEKLTWIEGKFDASDAKDILMNIFSTKIQYHKLKNFSSQIRFGKEDELAQNRIEELKKEIEKLSKVLSEAKSKDKKLVITSEISLSLLEDNVQRKKSTYSH